MAPKGRKPPRTNPYLKLISRFNELLVVLWTLRRTCGPPVSPMPQPDFTPKGRRRRLKSNLAYLMDFTKGGPTVTALGIAETEQYYQFLVACNEPRHRHRILSFMTSILEDLHAIISMPSSDQVSASRAFVEKCISFSRERIGTEKRFLLKSVEQCEGHLDRSTTGKDSNIRSWMQQFRKIDDHFELCMLAYENRKAPEMDQLKTKERQNNDDCGPSEAAKALSGVRHQIGRLAHHIRAPQQTIEDAKILRNLFDEYRVGLVDFTTGNSRPPPDALTTLPGILTRLLPARDPRFDRYLEKLQTMDVKFNIEKEIVMKLSDLSRRKACIHCEVQVLEHFHRLGLRFAGDDPFIGCSKPSCICCRLYFRHHPLRPVEPPESHQKLYPDWGLRALPNEGEDGAFEEQKRMLNKIIGELKGKALDQIEKGELLRNTHPDSRTGITASMVFRENAGSVDKHYGFSPESLVSGFADLSFESDDVSRTSGYEDSGQTSPFEYHESSAGESVVAPPTEAEEGKGESSESDEDSDEPGGAAL